MTFGKRIGYLIMNICEVLRDGALLVIVFGRSCGCDVE